MKMCLLYLLCSLYLRSVISQDVRPTQRLPGPDSLVTDGTRNLTLTCPAESSGGGQYTWFTPGNDKTRCKTQQSGKVCIFIPRLEDDNQNVNCTLIDPGPVFSTAFYQVNLKYPPQSIPSITIGTRQTEPLKHGDIITCTVTGGKPSVTSVTFHCQHPDHADREDDVNNRTHTVSSSIVVNTSLSTDVDMTCTCYANWAPEPGLYSHRTNMSFELQHPPQASPSITMEPFKAEPLGQGDTITCTVSGGSPLVTDVSFHCQNPNHADRKDVINEDDRTVSSSITVDTSQATEVNMTCTCSAYWDPEPGRYQDRTNMSFQPEYKARITEFTVNDTTKLTVSETSNSTVTFTCQGDGRPSPILRLFKQGNDTALIQAEINSTTQQLLYHIDNASGEDMATYRCEAANTFLVPNNTCVHLVVNSAPRFVDYNSSDPRTLPPEGLTFALVAYPTPKYNESHYLGNGNVTTPEPVPKNTFKLECTRNSSVEHLVNCHVTDLNVSQDKVGLYEVSVTNKFGDASFRFRVERKEPPIPDWIIIVSVVGTLVIVLLVIVIIVITVICLRRKKNAGHKKQSDSQNRNRNNETDVPVTHTTPTTGTAHVLRPDSTATTTYDKINDGPSSAGCNTTAVRCSTDSKGYASVGDASLQGSSKAAPTRHNNVPTTGYEDVELDMLGAPKIKNTPEKSKVDASIPEDSAERITDPKDYVYAKVAPKQKGDNQPIA